MTSRTLALCWLAGIAAAGCTSAQIVPADASGVAGTTGAGAAGTSGGAGGTSSAGAGGTSSAGTGGTSSGGVAGTSAGGAGGTSSAGAGGTSSGGGRGGSAPGGSGGSGGVGGSAGSAAGAGGRGGGGGGSGGAAGTGPGGTGGSAAGAGGSAGGGGRGGGGAAGSSGGAGGSAGAGGTAGSAAGAGGGGTAGAAVVPTVAGQIVITELMHDTDVVGDDFGEWFEVYNPDAAVTYDLMGCQVRDLANTHVISAHLIVPPHAFRTLAIFATGGGFVPDYTYAGIKFDNNAADEVNIYCGATLIDKFAYSTSLATVSGHAFSLDPAHYNAVDNDNPANYCLATAVYNTATSGTTTIRDYGTPGATNPPCQ